MAALSPAAGCGLGVLTRGLSGLTNAPEPRCVPGAWLAQAPVAPAAQQGGSGTGTLQSLPQEAECRLSVTVMTELPVVACPCPRAPQLWEVACPCWHTLLSSRPTTAR